MALADRRSGDAELPFWYLQIQGIPYLFLTHSVPWDHPDGLELLGGSLNIHTLNLPKESVSPGKPIASVGGMDFDLFDTHDSKLVSLFSMFFQDAKKTFLSTDMIRSREANQVIEVEDVSAFPDSGYLYIGNETVSYGGVNQRDDPNRRDDIQNPVFTGVTRGVFGSHITEHAFEPGFNQGAPVWDQPYEWMNRKIKLYRNWLKPNGTPYDSGFGKIGGHEELMFTGLVREIKQDTHRSRQFTILTNSVLSILKEPIAAVGKKVRPLSHYDISHVVPDNFEQEEDAFGRPGLNRLIFENSSLWGEGCSTLRVSVETHAGTLEFERDVWLGRELDFPEQDDVPCSWESFINGFNNLCIEISASEEWRNNGLPRPLSYVRIANRLDEGLVLAYVKPRGIPLQSSWTFSFDPSGLPSSVGPIFGYNQDVTIPEILPEEIGDHVEITGPKGRRSVDTTYFFHPLQTRWYVEDSSVFSDVLGLLPPPDEKPYMAVRGGFLSDEDGKVEENELVTLIRIESIVEQNVEVPGIAEDGNFELFERTYHYLTGTWGVLEPWEDESDYWILKNDDHSHIHVGSQGKYNVSLEPVPAFRNQLLGDVIRWLLLSSGTEGFNHGIWDKVFGRGNCMDLSPDDVELDSFDALGAVGGGMLRFSYAFLKPESLEGVLRAHLITAGFFLTLREGKISLQSWSNGNSLLREELPSLDHSVHYGRISQIGGISSVLTAVSLSLGYNPLSEDWALDTWNIHGQYNLDARGSRTLQLKCHGFWLENPDRLRSSIYLSAIWLLSVLGRPLPQLRVECSRKTSHLWLGDNVKVTAKGIWNPKTGSMDYNDSVFQIIGKQYKPGDGTVTFDLITMEGRGEKIGIYSPSAKVSKFDRHSLECVFEANAFSFETDNRGGQQTDLGFFKRISDADGFPLLARIHNWRKPWEFLDVKITEIDTDTNTLKFSDNPGVFGDGDDELLLVGHRLRLRDYDQYDQSDSKWQEHAFIADESNVIGAVEDVPFNWSQTGGRI